MTEANPTTADSASAISVIVNDLHETAKSAVTLREYAEGLVNQLLGAQEQPPEALSGRAEPDGLLAQSHESIRLINLHLAETRNALERVANPQARVPV